MKSDPCRFWGESIASPVGLPGCLGLRLACWLWLLFQVSLPTFLPGRAAPRRESVHVTNDACLKADDSTRDRLDGAMIAFRSRRTQLAPQLLDDSFSLQRLRSLL